MLLDQVPYYVSLAKNGSFADSISTIKLHTQFDTSDKLSKIASFAKLLNFLYSRRRSVASAAAPAAPNLNDVDFVAAAAGGDAGIDALSLRDDVVKIVGWSAFDLLGFARHNCQPCELRGLGAALKQPGDGIG